MTPEQLVKLKAEITGATTATKYADLTHEQIAAKLRAQAGKIDRSDISGGMIAASVVRSELAALNAADKAYLQAMIAAGDMPFTATLKTELGAIFPSGSTTRANFVALLKRDTTLAEELMVPGVTASDVADALRI